MSHSPERFEKNEKVYFPNLNGIRFVAASLVLIHHVEQVKSIYKLDSYWNHVDFIMIIGKLGVVLFFVLSGFLITYLLAQEESIYRSINVRDFYIRRILRIWPLYYLIFSSALFLLPLIEAMQFPEFPLQIVKENLPQKIALFVSLMPNLVTPIYGIVPYAAHTWSIGSEEQFYLLWPLILSKIKRNRIFILLLIGGSYLFTKTLLLSHYTEAIPFSKIMGSYISSFPIDCMIIGAVLALILFHKNPILKFLQRRDLFYFSLILVSFLIAKGIYIPYIHYEFYAVFFGIIILNFAINQKIKISLESNALNYLGKISYGIYMFHPIAIVLAIKTCVSLDLISNWIIYPLSFIITVLFAGISYRYFESYFLRLKDNFSKVHT